MSNLLSDRGDLIAGPTERRTSWSTEATWSAGGGSDQAWDAYLIEEQRQWLERSRAAVRLGRMSFMMEFHRQIGFSRKETCASMRSKHMPLAEENLCLHKNQICDSCGSKYVPLVETSLCLHKNETCASRGTKKTVLFSFLEVELCFSRKQICASRRSKLVTPQEADLLLWW